jgi:hypothetical protein
MSKIKITKDDRAGNIIIQGHFKVVFKIATFNRICNLGGTFDGNTVTDINKHQWTVKSEGGMIGKVTLTRDNKSISFNRNSYSQIRF